MQPASLNIHREIPVDTNDVINVVQEKVPLRLYINLQIKQLIEAYRGLVTTTVLSSEEALHRRSHWSQSDVFHQQSEREKKMDKDWPGKGRSREHDSKKDFVQGLDRRGKGERQRGYENKKRTRERVRWKGNERRNDKDSRMKDNGNGRERSWLRGEEWKVNRDAPENSQVCARCPGDRAVVALRGSDSVIMERPPAKPCYPWLSTNRIQVEVLMGPRPGTMLKEGSHPLLLQLLHKNQKLKTCHTRYNVIVRKCPKLETVGGVLANCPQGEVWGAKCDLSCREGYNLVGQPTVECGDGLEWTATAAHCALTTSCPVPLGPQNGHLSCRTPSAHHHSDRHHAMLPDGTICHYRCMAGFHVPSGQVHLTTMRCIAGFWDSSQDPTCTENNALDASQDYNLVQRFAFEGLKEQIGVQ